MKQTIQLRNVKNENLIFGILSFGLAAVLLYMAFFVDLKLRISGAKLDASTSAGLLMIIGIFPILTGINLIIRYFSVNKYGDFVLEMTPDTISFPYNNGLFKGYSKCTVQKSAIDHVLVMNEGRAGQNIYLYDFQRNAQGIISGNMVPYKVMKPDDLGQKIHEWLHS